MRRYDLNYEIAVIGGGPAGLSAAITAARAGRKVILLEKAGYLGGNATLGLPLLGFLDLDGRRIVGGIAQEYVNRLTEREECLGHRTCPKHNSVTNIDPEGFKILAIEMCREAGVDVILHVETCCTEVENGRLNRVVLFGKGNEISVEADIFIDCTGDGDVAYLAGCSYEAGQPDTGVLQPPTVMFTLENVDTMRLYDYIEEHPEEMTFSATIDHRPGYDADYFRASKNHVFVGLRKTFDRMHAEGKCPVDRETLIYIKSMNEGEVYVNSTHLLKTDATDIFSLTNAELEGQLQVSKLGSYGIVNTLITKLGFDRIGFFQDPEIFRGVLLFTDGWKSVGYNVVLFMATLVAISPELYEAAQIDGANKWQEILYITIPSILPTIVMVLILRVGNLLTKGFEQILVLYNPAVYDTADIIGTYVYRMGIGKMDFSRSAALGLFNSVVSAILVVSTNYISKKLVKRSLW